VASYDHIVRLAAVDNLLGAGRPRESMKVNEDLYVLQLPMEFAGLRRDLSLALIVNGDGALTLVDTGLPGQENLIQEAIEEAGFSPMDLKNIILTHQDVDHIGAAAALKKRTGATVWADAIEIPYIEGKTPLLKLPSPERLASVPDFAALWEMFRFCDVDQILNDGDVLPIAGGVRVVATPGHTPGHCSLLLERTKVLIAGDALVAERGVLGGPSEWATPEIITARESVKKLADFDLEAILCYHGGMVTTHVNDQLQRLSERASAPA
jgi:glyoxylase-like metal-dependent hydrolase (beta-lactamase superfamily II)